MDYSIAWHVFLLFVLMIMVLWFSMSRGKIIYKNSDLQSQKAEVKIDSPKTRKKLKKQLPFYFFPFLCNIYGIHAYRHAVNACFTCV